MPTGLLKAALAAGVMALLAGCQGIPSNYQPPAELQKASPAKVRDFLQTTCIKAQRAKQSSDTITLSKACGCYANRAIKTASKDDLQFLREKGYFSDAARPKLMNDFNACGLK